MKPLVCLWFFMLRRQKLGWSGLNWNMSSDKVSLPLWYLLFDIYHSPTSDWHWCFWFEEMWRQTKDQLCYSVWTTWFAGVSQTDWGICRSCFVHRWPWRFDITSCSQSVFNNIIFSLFISAYHADYARPLVDLQLLVHSCSEKIKMIFFFFVETWESILRRLQNC